MNTRRIALAGLALLALVAGCGDDASGSPVNSSTTRVAPSVSAPAVTQSHTPVSESQTTAAPVPPVTAPETYVAPPVTEQQPEATPPVVVPPVETAPPTATENIPPQGTRPEYGPTCANLVACVPGGGGTGAVGPDPDVNLPEDQ